MNSVSVVKRDSPVQGTDIAKLPPLDDQLTREMEKLGQMFWIDQQKLKDISRQLEVEIDRGLKENKQKIPMNITWVLGQPHGDEKGSFLAGDLGGTNLRVCWITLPGARGQPSIVQVKYQLSKRVKTGTADQTWDEVAERMQTFIRDWKLDENATQPLPLGFEIFRLVHVDLAKRQLIFKDQGISCLDKSYILDTGFLSTIEDDQPPRFELTATLFEAHTGIRLDDQERQICRHLAGLIAIRGARLCACGIAAICSKKNIKHGHVAADGSVANKHLKFKRRWADALAEILGWPEERPEDRIILTPTEDDLGIGAAVIVAMTLGRARKGDDAGVKDAADI